MTKSFYGKYDLISQNEQVYINRSSGYDGILTHNHDFIELIYIESGKGFHTVNNTTFAISSGDLFLMSPKDTHSIEPDENYKEEISWINCLFLPEFIDFDFSLLPAEYKYMGVHGTEMNSFFNDMLCEFSFKKPDYLKKIRAYLTIILIELMRLFEYPDKYMSYKNIRKNILIKNILSYIHERYTEDIRLPDISSHLSISTSYMSKIFKNKVGCSIVNYINKYRLNESCFLLKNTSMPVIDIAIQSGFNDVKFYYTVFERYFKMTPGKYRDMMNNKSN